MIVLTLNLCYLGDLQRKTNSFYFKNQILEIIVIVLTIILILSSAFVLIIEIINQ